MLKAFIKYADRRFVREPTEQSLRAAFADTNCTFWLDMEAPTEQELALLKSVFCFHPLAIEDTVGHIQRPKVENYKRDDDPTGEGYHYMVFHGPDLDTFRQRLRTRELDVFASSRYMVTVHDEPMRSVSAMLARAEAEPASVLDRGMDRLLHSILDRMVDNYQPILDYIDEALDGLEERAITDPQRSVLIDLALKKRELLDLRRIVGPQRDAVAQLTRGEVPFIRESTRVYLRDVQDHLARTVELVELYRDIALGARDIYLSSVSNNLNSIMKALTTFTVVALPATLITSFYGMNFNQETIGGWGWLLNHPAGFWGSMAVIGLLITGLLYFFRRNGWI